MRPAALLIGLAGIVAMPAHAQPTAEPLEYRAMERIAAALNGKASPKSVEVFLHPDAKFMGTAVYPFTIASMSEFLKLRSCGAVEAIDNQRVRSIAAMTSKSMDSEPAREATSGPGLWVYCVSSQRLAAHELYSFYFENGKVKRVYFTLAVAPPPPASEGLSLRRLPLQKESPVPDAATLLSADERIAIATRMIEAYNAQDADAYVAFMTDDACEAGYRGAVVREGKEGTRTGLAAAFAKWPQNRAEIRDRQAIGNYVLFREYVTRGPASDGSELVEPFEVIAVYSFEGDKVSRVEFIR